MIRQLTYYVFILFVVIGCSNDDSNTIIVVDFLDNDGDGVENTFEEVDNTDPNNPCDYMSNNQVYYRTTEAWRNLDCDGDGVSNGMELDPDGDGTKGPNNTQERGSCDYNPNHQVFVNTTEAWRNLHCDSDGVPNGAELDPDGDGTNNGNGTDPFDECSFNLEDQTQTPNNDWMMLDCDNDCKTNAIEIAEGTDPTDGADFLGAGDTILTIGVRDPGNPFFRKFTFDQGGTRLKEVTNNNGGLVASYSYDSNNNLTEVSFFNDPRDIVFSYQNGLITQVAVTYEGVTRTRTVSYDSNIIFTNDGSAPDGYFLEKFTLDPTSQRVAQKESFAPRFNQQYYYFLSEYTYDNSQEQIIEIYTRQFNYDANTDTFSELPMDWARSTYEYFDNGALNPAYNAYGLIYKQGLLEESVLYGYHHAEHPLTGLKLLKRDDYYSEYTGQTNIYAIDCTQPNNLPLKITDVSFGIPIQCYYE